LDLRDGIETSKNIENSRAFEFSSIEIPPNTPLLKGGCNRKLSDDSRHPLLARR
jgi:hypothetical protein